jgi:hypothetical protein
MRMVLKKIHNSGHEFTKEAYGEWTQESYMTLVEALPNKQRNETFEAVVNRMRGDELENHELITALNAWREKNICFDHMKEMNGKKNGF